MGVSGMWALFFVGSLAFAVSIFLPGYLQLRCLGFRRASSFAFSPLCSISEYAIVGALFGLAGVSVSSFVLYGTVLGASVLLFCLLGLRSRDFKFRFDECFDYRILFLYIAYIFKYCWSFKIRIWRRSIREFKVMILLRNELQFSVSDLKHSHTNTRT